MVSKGFKGLPEFDEVGNLIIKKPERSEEETLEEEDSFKIFKCQYCGKKWKKEKSRVQHERWCPEGPNPRTYKNKEKVKPKVEPKKVEGTTYTERAMGKRPVGGRPKKEVGIIKELKDFDKVFGLTDAQIIKYIRGKMK